MCSFYFFFFFFCPTDRPTFTRGRAMGNVTFYWDGLVANLVRKSHSKDTLVHCLWTTICTVFWLMIIIDLTICFCHTVVFWFWFFSFCWILLRHMQNETLAGSGQGKSQGISLRVMKKLNLWKKSGKSEILRVHIYSLNSLWTWIVLFW